MFIDFLIYFFTPVFIISFLLIYFKFFDKDWAPKIIMKIIFSSISSILIGFVLGGFIFGAYSSGVKKQLPKEDRITYSVDLVSMSNEKYESGSYRSFLFIGYGSTKSEKYYEFYYETPRGITTKKVKSNNVYFKETNGTPKYVEYRSYIKDINHKYYDDSPKSRIKRVFYLPSGTIKRNKFHVN